MIGAGGIISVQVGNNDPLTVLFEKTAGPSKGRMAQATGLADRDPYETMISEIAEETGILLVDRQNKKLTFLCITPDERLVSVFNRSGLIEELIEKKKGQIQTIREQLDGEMADWPIEIENREVGINPADEDFLENIDISMPNGHSSCANVIISDNERTANVNLMLPLLLQLPEGAEYIALDPETFKRPVSKFTRNEMITDDFITNKSSVPMHSYLKKVAAAYRK